MMHELAHILTNIDDCKILGQISGPQKAIYSDAFSLSVLDLYAASELVVLVSEVLVSEEHSFLGGVSPDELLSFLP